MPSYPIPNYNNEIAVGDPTYAIIIFILSIVFALLVYFLFLKPANEDKLEGFLKKLYDFLSFRVMTLEAFLRICYLFFAIFITLLSFGVIGQSFFGFLFILIVGNLIIRVVFEWSLLLLMLYKNTKDIREYMRPKKDKEKEK